jgi:hypothetical protein
MAEESRKQDQLLETTDCLEAVSTLKFYKNFFFLVIFLCLLILQGIFWLMPTEYVDRGQTQAGEDVAPLTSMLIKLVSSAEQKVKIETKTEKVEKAAQVLTTDANAAAVEPNAVKARPYPPIKIKFEHLAQTIRVCNYLLAVSAVTYSLVLLFAMKISLVGRLGGISHITRAVFLSLFMVVLILPWQLLFRPVLFGAIYTPDELLSAWTNFDKASITADVLRFLRFTALWLIVLLLLLRAQLKSMRWAKNTLKRLGIAG